MSRPRYAFLFDIPPGDYAAWAHGLKKAGYATNPNYAFILIKLIEDYRLFLLDTFQPMMRPLISLADKALPNQRPDVAVREAARFQKNRIDYYVAQPGDNVKSVTEKLDLLNWQIRKYNEIPKNKDLVEGQVIYLQPKRRQAETGYSFHTAARGETMYSISQLYGIKMHWLYKRNRMKKGEEPKVGQEIWLRGMKGR
jgi:LysM repeat protein